MTDKKTKPLAKEQAHQEKAFEYYYGLGEKRSYEKVSKKYGVALSTVKLWGQSFGWKNRIKERDLQIAREMASRALSDEVSRRERSLQIVQMALIHLAKAIAEGKVKMTLADLDKLIRLEAFLSDLPDSRQEVVFADLKNKTTGELREMMRQEIEMLKELDVSDQEIQTFEQEGNLLGDGNDPLL
jgi:transposase